MNKNFFSWLKRLNEYTEDAGYKHCVFEDDETTRELFNDGKTVPNAFQELMGA